MVGTKRFSELENNKPFIHEGKPFKKLEKRMERQDGVIYVFNALNVRNDEFWNFGETEQVMVVE